MSHYEIKSVIYSQHYIAPAYNSDIDAKTHIEIDSYIEYFKEAYRFQQEFDPKKKQLFSFQATQQLTTSKIQQTHFRQQTYNSGLD